MAGNFNGNMIYKWELSSAISCSLEGKPKYIRTFVCIYIYIYIYKNHYINHIYICIYHSIREYSHHHVYIYILCIYVYDIEYIYIYLYYVYMYIVCWTLPTIMFCPEAYTQVFRALLCGKMYLVKANQFGHFARLFSLNLCLLLTTFFRIINNL